MQHSLDSYLFFSKNNSSQQLIFETFHGDREVDDRSLGADFRRVRRITEFGGDIENETCHDIYLFVANFNLGGKYKRDGHFFRMLTRLIPFTKVREQL